MIRRPYIENNQTFFTKARVQLICRHPWHRCREDRKTHRQHHYQRQRQHVHQSASAIHSPIPFHVNCSFICIVAGPRNSDKFSLLSCELILTKLFTILDQLLYMPFFLVADGLDKRSGLAAKQRLDFTEIQQGVLFKV